MAGRHDPETEEELNEAWRKWAASCNTLFFNGARLAMVAERNGWEPSGQAALGFFIYQRLTERHVDAAIRQILDDE